MVLDVLRYGLEREGVTLLTQAMVRQLIPSGEGRGGGYIICIDSGRKLWAGRVILACGGQAAPKTGSDGTSNLSAGIIFQEVIETLLIRYMHYPDDPLLQLLGQLRKSDICILIYGLTVLQIDHDQIVDRHDIKTVRRLYIPVVPFSAWYSLSKALSCFP